MGTNVSGSAGEVLEVRQRWGELWLDARPFRSDDEVVRVGAKPAWRWRLLGIDMGIVSDAMARGARWALPLWSELEATTAEDFLCDGPEEGWEVARFEDGDWWMEALEGWPVSVRVDDRELALDELGPDRVRRGGGRVRVRLGREVVSVGIGSMVFELTRIGRGPVLERPGVRVDPVFAAAATLCLGMGLTFGAVTGRGSGAPPIALEPESPPLELLLELPTPKPVEVAVAKDPAKKVAQRGSKGPVSSDRRPPKGGREEARSSGVLGSDALAMLDGDGALDAALASGVGGLIGARGNAGIGSAGLGGRTGGLGGGGGVEGLDFGGPRGPGGRGGGGGLGDGKQEGLVDAPEEERVYVGAIASSAIDEVVKQHLAALRYCYQRELNKDPQLQGKVTTKFVIAADGSVSSSQVQRSTVGSDTVDACVAGRFMKMRFPQPKGGGIVIVSYPLAFTRGG